MADAKGQALEFIQRNRTFKNVWVIRPDLTNELNDANAYAISRSHKPQGCRKFEIVMVFCSTPAGIKSMTKDARTFSIACGGNEISMQIAAAQAAHHELKQAERFEASNEEG